jgi:hypothetical protein
MKNNSKKNHAPKSPTSLTKSSSSVSLDRPVFPLWLQLGVLLLLGIIIYSNSFNCSFHLDDIGNITDNAVIKLLDIKKIWEYSHNRFFGYLSLAINYHFGAFNLWGYHFVNLLIHLINTLIVYWLTRLILATPALNEETTKKQKLNIAFFTALLFVTHPLATQSVTYLIQRLASIAAMFYFLSVAFYIKARMTEAINKKIILFTLFLLSVVIALHCKENTYTIPFIILLVEACLFTKQKFSFNIKDYRIIAGFIVTIIGLSIILYKFPLSIFNTIPPSFGTNYSITSTDYLFTQFSVIFKYIQLLILPINQNLDYDYPLSTGFFEPRTLICFMLLLGLMAMAIYYFNRKRIISFGIGWFLITLSVESSFIPIADLIFEHRTYLPSPIFFLVFVYLFFTKFSMKNMSLPSIVFLTIGLIYAGMTFNRNKIWENEFTLWSDVITKSPEKARPWHGRADVYREQGQWKEAIDDYNEAIRINPNYVTALNNLGLVYKSTGQYDKAIFYYSKSISLDSTDVNAFINRGVVLGLTQRFDEAIKDMNKALAMHQKINTVYNNRGNIYAMMQNWELALHDFDSAIALSPNYAAAYKNRGCVYLVTNKLDKAIDDFNKAIEISPNFTEAYFYKGEIYKQMQEWNKAIAEYDAALKIDPNYTIAINARNAVIQFLSTNK